jgi:hypothetical protein
VTGYGLRPPACCEYPNCTRNSARLDGPISGTRTNLRCSKALIQLGVPGLLLLAFLSGLLLARGLALRAQKKKKKKSADERTLACGNRASSRVVGRHADPQS